MRILFEITHPKHAHLFHNAILELRQAGHEIRITARRKDVTLRLLDAWGLDYKVLTNQPKSGLLALGTELLIRDLRLWRFARRFRPDVLVARVGPCAAHVGLLLRKPVIVFEDTEDATLQQRLAFPFATRICTAIHYEKEWGHKHIRYRSFDELAYLHPNRFTADPGVVQQHGLEPGSYIIVRFVSWKAAHDIGEAGIGAKSRLGLLERLEAFGRVLVTSEAPLPATFERFRLPVPPEQFHHVLAFAKLTFGESSTVATEGAMLGVPGVLVNTMNWGSVNSLVRNYGMLFQTTSETDGLAIAEDLLSRPDLADAWAGKRSELLSQEGDLTEWMIDEVLALKGVDACPWV